MSRPCSGAASSVWAKPPEEWLYKGWEGDLLTDFIFDPAGNPVDDAMFERAEDLEVQAVAMKVMALEDVMATKLLAMREHEVDYDDSLEIARALREQIDWDAVWEQTSDSPYARTFFYLAEQLGILDGGGPARAKAVRPGRLPKPPGERVRVRVKPSAPWYPAASRCTVRGEPA
jgi:hypothetical protein